MRECKKEANQDAFGSKVIGVIATRVPKQPSSRPPHTMQSYLSSFDAHWIVAICIYVWQALTVLPRNPFFRQEKPDAKDSALYVYIGTWSRHEPGFIRNHLFWPNNEGLRIVDSVWMESSSG